MPKVKLRPKDICMNGNEISGGLYIETPFVPRLGTLPNLLAVKFSGNLEDVKIERDSTSKIINAVLYPYDIKLSPHADFIERVYDKIESGWKDIYQSLKSKKTCNGRVELSIPLERENRILYCVGGISSGKKISNHTNNRDEYLSSGSKH